MKNQSIIELSQGWAAEDAKRVSRFSDGELAAAAELILGTGGDQSRRADRLRQFATTSGSASVLTADVAAREMQQLYQHTPRIMRNVVRVRKGIPSYNEIEAIRFDGAESTLPVIREAGEYGQITLAQSQTDTYKVLKYGARFEITEEALMADPVRVFETLPTRMLRGAIRTEEAFLTSLFFSSTGPSTSFFAQQSGAAPSTLPLTIENLRTAVGQMAAYQDSSSDPIVAMPKFLMVPPALMIKGMELLNSINLNHVVDGSGSGPGTALAHGSRNVLADLNIELLVNPWIPAIVTSGTKGATSWALFTDPSNIPAGEFGTLAGYDVPQVKPLHGDAEDRDVLSWRVKHVFGGTTIDKRAGWASVGQ